MVALTLAVCRLWPMFICPASVVQIKRNYYYLWIIRISQVISLFAVSGGLAVECVRQGHPDFLPKLVEGVGDAIEDELVAWINENGGWIGLSLYVRPVTAEFTPLEWIAIALGGLLGMFLLIFLLKFIGFHVIPSILF